MAVTVKLGRHENLPVVAQPVPVLCDILGLDVDDIVKVFTGGADQALATLRRRFEERGWREGHALMCELIPALHPDEGGMPLHEWMGYGSQEDMEVKRFDRKVAREVTPDNNQIVEALWQVLMANGGEKVGELMGARSPQLARAPAPNGRVPQPALPTSPGATGG